MPDLILTPSELEALTSYSQPSLQLAELHKQGFWRARRGKTGAIILEREHYRAVCSGRDAAQDRPRVRHVNSARPVLRSVG